MDFLTTLHDELNTQMQLQKIYTDSLCTLPEGSLWTKRRKDGTQYYLKLPGFPPQYLSKNTHAQLISQLQSKQFFIKNLNKINVNIPLLQQISEKYLPLNQGNIQAISNFSVSENIAYPERLIYHTSFGMKVRSKSEAMISDALYIFHVPQFYERKLVLVGAFNQPHVIYPDFTIPLPDGNFIYWEHKGRMDDPKYRQRSQRKDALYFDNGIYPPHNLIITMDGPNQEFNLQEIHQIIKGIILPRLGQL